MHEPGSRRWSPFRLAIVLAVALLLGLPVVQISRADDQNEDTSIDWQTRADMDIEACNAQGGTAEMDFVSDAGGNIIGVTVSCTWAYLVHPSWDCTETPTQSTCSNPVSVFPAPTYSPLGPRPPVNPVANPGQVSGSQPTPTPLPPLLLNTLQNQTTAEMSRCTAQGGTSTRVDTRIGSDLHETLVQCTGGGQDGTVCLNTSAGANCQTGIRQTSKQPVLQIRNPGQTAPTPTTAATRATLSLQPVTTPGATAPAASPTTATPPSNTGNRTVIGGIAVKPGPAKLPPEDNSAIYVSAWTCPVTVNPTSSLDQLKGACKDLHNTDFELTGTGVVTSFPKGDIAKSGLPAGQYTIRELIPDHYGLGPTYCTFVPAGSPPPTVWTAAYNEYDGYYEFALGDSQTVYCDWFNFLEVPATPTPTATPKPGTTIINGSNAGLKPEVTTVASTPTS